MKIKSDSFEDEGNIPSRYSCQGEDINPSLMLSDVPQGARTLVLIVDDPDAPMGTWTHWLVWDIEPREVIKEGSIPGIQGKNDFGKNDYGGPCPPSGTHRYFFKIYAMDSKLGLKEGASRSMLEESMNGHVLDKCSIMGRYKRK